MQRDRAKKARAAAKRERRQGHADPSADRTEEVAPPAPGEGALSPAELLARVEDLHRRFDSKQIDFETFEEEKAELMRRLPVD